MHSNACMPEYALTWHLLMWTVLCKAADEVSGHSREKKPNTTPHPPEKTPKENTQRNANNKENPKPKRIKPQTCDARYSAG